MSREFDYEGRLLKRIRELEAELKDARAETDRWRSSWENIVFDVGDLARAVRDRPKGRRFATVVDLLNLLRKEQARS